MKLAVLPEGKWPNSTSSPGHPETECCLLGPVRTVICVFTAKPTTCGAYYNYRTYKLRVGPFRRWNICKFTPAVTETTITSRVISVSLQVSTGAGDGATTCSWVRMRPRRTLTPPRRKRKKINERRRNKCMFLLCLVPGVYVSRYESVDAHGGVWFFQNVISATVIDFVPPGNRIALNSVLQDYI